MFINQDQQDMGLNSENLIHVQHKKFQARKVGISVGVPDASCVTLMISIFILFLEMEISLSRRKRKHGPRKK